MFRGDGPHTLSYEQQTKFIQDRITNVEKHFGDLCVAFADYARKTARLRDKGDELAKCLKEYAGAELVNKSLSAGLANVAVTLTAVEEYRNCEIQRLEAKVIGELSQYEGICKSAREELRHTNSVREKELSRKKTLDRARERQPFNRQQVTYAESELVRAAAETSRSARGLGEQTEFFERRKLLQLKTLLRDFALIEMHFHARALELCTAAYRQVDAIDDKADLDYLHAGLTEREEASVNTYSRHYQVLQMLYSSAQHPDLFHLPQNFKRKLLSPEKPAAARSASLGSLLHQSPARDDDSMEYRKSRSPDIASSKMARSNSLAVLMDRSNEADTGTEESEAGSTSEATESD